MSSVLYVVILIKDALKSFDDFQKKQQMCLKQCFLICKSIHVLKIFLDKKNGSKNALFFFLRAPTHSSFSLNLRHLYELKHIVCLSKLISGIFNFRFRFVFMKVFIFIQRNVSTLSL